MSTARIQIDTEQLAATISALAAFQESFNHHNIGVFQHMQALVEDMYAGNIQALIGEAVILFNPRCVGVNQALDAFIRRLTALLERICAADQLTPGCGLPTLPSPRVYFINGINATEHGAPEPEMIDLKHMFATNTFIPEHNLVPLNAIYNQDSAQILNNPFATGLQGWQKDLGLFGYPVGYVAHVFSPLISSPVTTAVGVNQVLQEQSSGGAMYTKQMYAEIQANIVHDPLLPGQKVIIVAHSGGGAVASNLVPLLEKDGIDVAGTVTLGSPAVDDTRVTPFGHALHIVDRKDALGQPWLHRNRLSSVSPNPFIPRPYPLIPGFAEEYIDVDPNIDYETTHSTGHSSYMTNPEVVDYTAEHFAEMQAWVKPEFCN